MRITYAAATSIDGFIARKDGDVSWLDDVNVETNETDLEQFFSSIDGLVMGRNTYNFVLDYGSWPYENKPTWVCTHSQPEFLDGANLIIADEIDRVVKDAESRGLEHLWLVGGGQLASSFLEKDLITNLNITEMPVELKSGIPLFAAHKLDEIATDNKKAIQKNGFRQIKIVIKRQFEH